MKNMVFRTMGDLLIAVHGQSNMTDEEARVCNAALRNMDLDKLRVLVCTEGGGASATQRRDLVNSYGGRNVPTAVVTDVRMVRGVITALSWFNKKMRAFPVEEIEDALRYLEVPETRVEAILREVERLRVELTTPSIRGTASV